MILESLKSEEVEMALEDINLTFKSKKLKNERILSTYKIKENSTIFMNEFFVYF